jgi:hypothetical protein
MGEPAKGIEHADRDEKRDRAHSAAEDRYAQEAHERRMARRRVEGARPLAVVRRSILIDSDSKINHIASKRRSGGLAALAHII